ncbi:hypothetical protein [Actinophytocola xanthii]|uniref:hypothetical protein n=1 Tax=Actinophytocola xanthii TaxID=1912961 RepID=UPI0038BC9FC5
MAEIATRFTALYDEFVGPALERPEEDGAVTLSRFSALGAQAVYELTRHSFRETNARRE